MLASFSIVPIGVGAEMSGAIAEVVQLVGESGLAYRLGPMETTIEGPPEAVMAVIMDCHRLLKAKAPRVVTHIAIDDHGDRHGELDAKVRRVQAQVGRGAGGLERTRDE